MSEGLGKLESFNEDAALAFPLRGKATMTDKPEKVDLASPDLTAQQRAALLSLFPGVLQDGVLDAAKLGDLLGVDVTVPASGRDGYGLVWAGKSEAVRSLQMSSRASLVPDIDRSVEWDTAQNVFIEGDNLEVLKLLQKAYNDKVKVIYIDPPYNTGKGDFVYNDDFRDGLKGYLAFAGLKDANGNLVSTVSASEQRAGGLHSRWLSMMYPRLQLARNLLTPDGVIFISIDDNEVATLRLLLDEVFGPENFVENYIWESNFRPDNSSPIERENSQHVLCYARSKDKLGRLVGAQKKTEGLPSLTKNSMKPSTIRLEPDWVDFGVPDGEYGPGELGGGYILEDRIAVQGGKALSPFRLTGRVIWSQGYLEAQIAAGTRIVIKGATFVPYSKKAETAALPPTSLIPRDDVGDVLAGNAELRALFGRVPFNHPKPTSLIRYLVNAVTHDDRSSLVLDFFAGSGSTAHAVALLNAEDGGSRRTISVNLPEPTDPASDAAALGYTNVAQVTHARISKVLGQVEGAKAQGLRTFLLAESNFVQPSPEGSAGELVLIESTLKATDLNEHAVTAEVLLKEGVTLDVPWETHYVDETKVVVAGKVAVVLSLDITKEVVEAALKLTPESGVVVFLEDGFAGRDAVKTNAVTDANKLGIRLKTV